MWLYALVLLTPALLFPSPEEQERISKPYSECLQTAAERYDDGQSDIAVVGKAVAAACNAELEEVIAKLGEHLSSDDRQTLSASVSAMQIGYAAVAIGKVRARRRSLIDH